MGCIRLFAISFYMTKEIPLASGAVRLREILNLHMSFFADNRVNLESWIYMLDY